MKVAYRAVAVFVVLSLAYAGPLAPLAGAQQPAPPPAQVPAPGPMPAQPAQPPQMFQEEVKPLPQRKGIDGYDVGAVAATALGFPFKVGLCALGTAFSVITFAATWGARPDASTAILNEGCGAKAKWIVRGSDIRPREAVTKAFEWEEHRFEWEK
jgi:hypothetical protein